MELTDPGTPVRRLISGLLLSSALLAAGCGGGEVKGREMDGALRALVDNAKRPAFVTADAEGTKLWKQTREFYEKRAFAPAWIENAEPRPQMEALTAALLDAHGEGLDPELYNVTLLEERRVEASKGFLTKQGFDPTEAGALDVWLTYLYMKYASDLADGVSDLATADPNWMIKPEKFDPLAHLQQALDSNRIKESLTDLTPDTRDYVALRDMLADYREIEKNGGWQPVPVIRLKPGQKSPAVRALAMRLAATGDYRGRVPGEGQAAEYTSDLQDAVKHFQSRHGLTPDGVVGPEVQRAMNVPVEARIGQIELNMERWRWLPRALGDRHIIVNIPEMKLNVWDKGEVPLTMRVVVGTRETPTPIFTEDMSYLVFSPYWNVPDSIAQGETLPAVMQDAQFLERNNMEILDAAGTAVDARDADFSDPTQYRFRQKPGGQNSLGLVKFMFPNQFNVYLHDTPADSLFTRASRSFSHGCVRLEDPVALARYVLKDQPTWTEARIHEAMQSGEETTVKLTSVIPVYLGYWTASVDGDGVAQFRNDVYGIDAQLRAKVKDRLNRLRAGSARSAAYVSEPAAGAKEPGQP